MKKYRKVSVFATLFCLCLASMAVVAVDSDGDGWLDSEEVSAGTDPFNSTDFPRPEINVTSSYSGLLDDFQSYPLIVYAYSESTAGTGMGGAYDAILKPESSRVMDFITFDSNGSAKLSTPKIAPRTIKIAGHRHAACDTPNDVSSGSLWCYYSGSPTVNYNTGVILGGAPGVSAKMFYETTEAIGRHVRSGWNRFFGFLDVNGNGVFDIDEPAGLSVSSPTAVSWDAVDIDIALTDAEHLTGYPRISWDPILTNTPYASIDHYAITIAASGGGSPVTVNVKKPRTFMHEGDFIAAGINGLDFGARTVAAFEYNVTHGDDVISSGVISYNLGVTPYRVIMDVIYPTTNDVVDGTGVEFKWKMDYRNEGALLSIFNRGPDGLNLGSPLYDDLINFPVRHGSITSKGYYYSAVPQNVNGKTTFSLPPGSYNYTIKEYIKTTSGTLTKQSTNDWFQVTE